MATTTTSSPLLALPEDLLLRVLIGVPRADHGATAAACGAFRAVMSGPRFLRLRRDWGFAERGIVLVESEKGHLRDTELHGLLKIRTAHDGGVASVSIGLKLMARDSESTTDGGARLFLCTNDPQADNEVIALDASRRRWKHFTTFPVSNLTRHCMEWHGSCLYVAGGYEYGVGVDYLNTFFAFNELTGLWETLPSMPHACMFASSGVIGDQLYVVGGFSFVDDTEGGPTNILQIYDIPTRTWRLGARHPEELSSAWRTLVADGKLFLLNPNRLAMGIYFPQEDMWMHVALDRAWVRAFDSARFELGSDDYHECCECAHNGRVVIFYSDGAAFERSNHNGFWSRYEAAAPDVLRDYDKAKGELAAFGSVLLG